MKNRVRVDQTELREVFKELQNRGFSKDKINEEIGARFDSALYRGYTMTEESFGILEKLLGRTIPRIIEKFIINKNENTAELVGILLGDGHIGVHRDRHYHIEVSLNGTDDEEYVEYVKDLMEHIFKRKVSVNNTKSKAVKLVVYSKLIVKALIELGLKSGNKVKNQVGVPEWIRESSDFSIACLRGLSDTDGSLCNIKGCICFSFRNYSTNLLIDFKEMCNSIGVKTGKIGKTILRVRAKSIRKFIRFVRPFKWKVRKQYLLSKLSKNQKYVWNVRE